MCHAERSEASGKGGISSAYGGIFCLRLFAGVYTESNESGWQWHEMEPVIAMSPPPSAREDEAICSLYVRVRQQ